MIALEYCRSKMWEMSKRVLRDSALQNGSLVTANGIYLPPTATAYHYVWARDASKQLLAAHALGMDDAADIRENFLLWIIRCLPGGKDKRLFIKRNQINGPNDFLYNDDRGFQPDNNGSLLSALAATCGRADSIDTEVMRLLANGLADTWDLDQHKFTMRQQDQWENDTIEPEEDNFFTHALLAAAHGLSCAARSLGNTASASELSYWREVSQQMYGRVMASQDVTDHIYFHKRLFDLAGTPDLLDAGLALAIPAWLPDGMPVPLQQKALKTIEKIGQELLVLPYGAKRYEGDTYDGIERLDGSQSVGGPWPLLAYAWVRAARQLGLHEPADAAQDALDANLEKLYKAKIIPEFRIPEQVHPIDDPRNGLGPVHFAWGSAEWVLAEKDRRGRLAHKVT